MDSSEHFAFRAGSSPLYAKGIVFTKKRLRNMMLIDYAGNSVLLRLSVTYPKAERLLEWAANYNIPVLDHRC